MRYIVALYRAFLLLTGSDAAPVNFTQHVYWYAYLAFGSEEAEQAGRGHVAALPRKGVVGIYILKRHVCARDRLRM